MRKLIIVFFTLASLFAGYGERLMADDPRTELSWFIGVLTKEREPEIPDYPHAPSTSVFRYAYNGSELVVTSDYSIVGEIILSDNNTGEVLLVDISELSSGYMINTEQYGCESYKISVRTETGTYSAVI